MLDEPTAHLDVYRQLSILDLVSRLQRERGLTVIVALHDLDHAARFANRVVALAGGKVHAHGAPETVVTAKLLADVFAVEGRVIRDQGRLRAIIDARNDWRRPIVGFRFALSFVLWESRFVRNHLALDDWARALEYWDPTSPAAWWTTPQDGAITRLSHWKWQPG